MACRFSRAPLSLPGKFTMSAVPRVAACARDNGAIAVFCNDATRITSPNPGTTFSHTLHVASGVTSRAAIPVPPVVTTNRAPSPVAASIASAMPSMSSDTTTIASTSYPLAARISRTAGPDVSTRSPREAASEQVMTRARIMARDSMRSSMPIMPRVTVLIPTYHDAPFLGAAIDSILAQTFTDFELLVIDDASTDRSREIVEAYRDPRIRLIVNETNRGGAGARNRGLAAATGEYVAQLDGNDVAFPRRLAEQVAYLDAHPEVAVAGSQGTMIDVVGRTIGVYPRPITELGIRWSGIFQSPLIHSSVMWRRAILWDELGGYDERLRSVEDFELSVRAAKRYAIHNLPEPLVAHRDDPMSITGMPRHPAREGHAVRKAALIIASIRETLQWTDVPPHSVDRWLALGDSTLKLTTDDLRIAVDFLERCAALFASIHGTNDEVATHQAALLARALGRASSVSRLFSLRLWTKIWRRHRPTALRALPRLAIISLLGEWPLHLHRHLRRRRAQRWKQTGTPRRA